MGSKIWGGAQCDKNKKFPALGPLNNAVDLLEHLKYAGGGGGMRYY